MGKNSTQKSDSLFCDEFVHLVQQILDKEATEADIKLFNNHYMKCSHCISYYNLESNTVEFLKTKIKETKTLVPEELAQEIRTKVLCAPA